MTKFRKALLAICVVVTSTVAVIGYDARAASMPSTAQEDVSAANLTGPAVIDAAVRKVTSGATELPMVGKVGGYVSLAKVQKIPPMGYWDEVAQCETQQDWKDRGNFSGGLGIAQQTWVGYGGREFAPTPYKATKEEQIIVANRIAIFGYQTKNDFLTLADRQQNKPYFRPASGFGGWGCVRNSVGHPYAEDLREGRRIPASAGFCEEIKPLLKAAGMSSRAFKKATYVAWKESRCDPAQFNPDDPNGGSRGLFQINGAWTEYLTEAGIISSVEDLFDPWVNVQAAVEIWRYSKDKSGYGWGPWNV